MIVRGSVPGSGSGRGRGRGRGNGRTRRTVGVRRAALGVALGAAAAATVACAAGAKDKGEDTTADAVADAPAAVLNTASARRRDRAPTVLFVGTSLTAGLGLDQAHAYPALVQRRARAAGLPIRAVNAGVSGETSAGARQRIGWVLRGTPADIVVIETGANDALRALPVAAARANIAAIIDSVRRIRPAARIALVQMEAPPNLGPEYTGAFRALYGELAAEKRVLLIPFLLDRVAGVDTLNQPDGLHPNARGERIVATNVWQGLEPLVRSVALARRGTASTAGRGRGAARGAASPGAAGR